MDRNIDDFLRRDCFFTEGYEPYAELLDELAKGIVPNVSIKYIKSNLALNRTAKMEEESQFYIIWDERYWDIYLQYLALITAPTNESGEEGKFWRFHELGQWVVGLFTSYLSERYDKVCSLSNALYTDLSTTGYGLFQKVFAYELEQEDRERPLRKTIFFSKAFVLYHELGHIFCKNNAEFQKELFQDICNVIKPATANYLQVSGKELAEEQKEKIEKFAEQLSDYSIAIKENYELLQELAADCFAARYAILLWRQCNGCSKESAFLLRESIIAFSMYNSDFEAVKLMWDAHFSKKRLNEADYTREADAEEKDKTGILNCDYKETLSMPYVSRKKLNLNENVVKRENDGQIQNLFRNTIFKSVILINAMEIMGCEDLKAQECEFEINREFVENLVIRLNITLLDSTYISSRILHAIKTDEKAEEVHEYVKALYKTAWDGVRVGEI